MRTIYKQISLTFFGFLLIVANASAQCDCTTDMTPPTFTTPPNLNASAQISCPDSLNIVLTGYPTNIMDNNCDPVADPLAGWTLGDDSWTTPEDYTISFSDALMVPQPWNQCDISGNGLHRLKWRFNRTWTVTDPCGNATTATHYITIIDDDPPVITCPPNVTSPCGDDRDPANNPSLGEASATDNCDTPTISYADSVVLLMGSCISDSTIYRMWIAEDACGLADTCTQIITLEDLEGPTFDLPADMTIFADADCMYEADTTITGVPTNIMDCDPNPVVTYMDAAAPVSCGGLDIVTRTWTIEDACGNISTGDQIISVVDNTPPYFVNCPPNITVECDDIDPELNFLPDAEDNCIPGALFVPAPDVTIAPGFCSEEYVLFRIWTIEDNCGNTTTCEQQIQVQDTTLPDFEAPGSFIGNDGLNCGDEDDLSIVGFPANLTDNCIPDEFDGSSGYSPGDILWVTNEGYTVSFTDTDDTPASGWVCTITSNGLYKRKYRILRTWRVEDFCGNFRTRTQSIVITDTTPPEWDLPLPADENVECDVVPAALVGGIDLTAQDLCDGINVDYGFTQDSTAGICVGDYILERTYTVSDVCDNSTSFVQTITVTDTTSPVPDCPDDTNVECDAIPAPVTPTVTDNCSTTIGNTFDQVDDLNGCNGTGTITRTWVFDDGCGNTAECVQVLTVEDNTPPTWDQAMPADATVNCQSVPTAPMGLTYSDNCGADNQDPAFDEASTQGVDPAMCDYYNYTLTRTWTATDECGNDLVYTQTIIVQDVTLPNFTVPGNVLGADGLECDDDQTPAGTGFPTLLTDNCLDPEADGEVGYTPGASTWMTGNYTVSFMDVIIDPHPGGDCSLTSNGLYRKYRINRTWTVEDACGNSRQYTQEINVVDGTPPVLIDPAEDCSSLNATGINECLTEALNYDISILEAAVAALYEDNCPEPVTATLNNTVDDPANTDCAWSFEYEFTISDDCGNTVTCLVTRSGGDDEEPQLVGSFPADEADLVLCFADIPAGPTEGEIEALYEDNCSDVTVVKSGTPTGDDCSWTVTYTYEIEDDCGNMVVPSPTITYSGGDTEAPDLVGVLPGGDLGNVCFDAAPAAVPVGDIEVLYTDNCGDVTAILIDTDLTGDDCSWSVTYTYTIEDECGNFSPNAIVTYLGGDTGQPDFVVPADVVGNDGLECDEDQTPAGTGFPTMLTDNCLDPEADGESGYTPGASSWMTGDYTVSFMDVIEDPHPSGDCSLTGNGDYYRKYRINRTWTVEDACNNSRQYTQQINVVDGTPPVLIDPAEDCSSLNTTGINECLTEALNYDISILEAAVAALYEDNCPDPVTATLSGTTPGQANTDCAWSFEYEFTISDVCGNTTTCLVTRSGGDDEEPQLTGTFPADEADLILCFADIPVGPTVGDIEALFEDNCSDVTVVKSGTPTGDDCNWTVTYTYEIQDDCGNMVLPSPTITYSGGDTEAPQFVGTLPGGDLGNVCIDDAPGAVPVSDIEDQYTDNCGDVTAVLIDTDLTGDDCSWTATFTYTIEDECGNFATNAEVTFFGGDTGQPDFVVPADVVGNDGLECDEDQTPAGTGFPTLLTDNCLDPEADGETGYTPGATSWMTGDYAVSFVDAIEDPHPNGDCSLTGNGDYYRKYRINRTWTVEDACNNSRQYTQQINVVDGTPPALIDLMEDCSTLNTSDINECLSVADAYDATTLESAVAALYEDNCPDPVTATLSGTTPDPANTDCAWSFEYEFTISDVCGNTTTCIVTRSGGDTEEPQLTGILPVDEADLVLCFADIPVGPTEGDIEALYADNCSDVTVVKSGTPTGDDCSWTVTYTYEIEDDCGNMVVPSPTITYSGGDTEAPILQSAFPVGQTGMNLCFADVPEGPTEMDIQALYDDNCGDVTVVKTGSPTGDNCNWTVTYTYEIEDECGNMVDPSPTITYSGGDTESPTFTPPANIVAADTLSCEDEDDLSLTGFPTNIADNCNPDQANGSDGYSPGDTIWVTANGYTVSFTSFLTMPQPFAECSISGNGLHNRKYQISRVWTVTDPCNNSTTALQTINIIDDTPPVWSQSMPVDLTVECDAIPTAEVGGVDLLATDNCDDALDLTYGFNQDSIPGNCMGNYTLERTWTVEDVCGNSISHLQVITAEDNTAPILAGTLPGGNVGNICYDSIPPAPSEQDIADLYTDNCGTVSASLISSDTTGTDCSWTTTYSYTVTDDCNNSFNIDIIYTGGDTEAPVLAGTLPGGDLGNVCLADAPGAVPVGDIEAEYTDNCGDITATLADTDITGDDCSWSATFTYTIEDECGNFAANAVVNFFGGDSESPTFTPPANIIAADTLSCGDEDDLSLTGFPSNIEDNCAADQTDGSDGYSPGDMTWVTSNGYTVSFTSFLTMPQPFAECATSGNGLHNLKYQVSRVWTVTDPCDNSTTALQTINIIDDTPPEWSQPMPVDLTVECDAIPTAEVGGVDLLATDNCDDAMDLTYDFNQDSIPGSCPGSYTLERTWTVEDVCGNSTFHVQTINVEDTTDPTWDDPMPADATVECDAVPAAPTFTGSDNCTDVTVSFGELATQGMDDTQCDFYNYTITRTWTATDACNNAITHTQVITVEDTEAPAYDDPMPDDTTVSCDAIPVAPVFTATDNCQADVTVSFGETATQGMDDTQCDFYNYEITRTWVAEDACGNANTHIQIITVEDVVAPILMGCPTDVTINCNDALPTPPSVTATDNCDADPSVSGPVDVSTQTNDGSCTDQSYTVTRTWTAEDACGNTETCAQVVTLIDNNIPVISLIGADTILLCVGDAYMDPGATALDACFGDISGDIVVNNPVNTALAGTYVVTYDVSDPCANAAVQVSRIVIVYDHPLLETSINGVIVTSNNDGLDDVAMDIEVCSAPNNITFNYITDLNMVPGNVRVYQTIALTNATVGFCNNCSAIPSGFAGATGSAQLIDPTMDGLLTIRLRGWQDRNNNNIIDPEECAGDWIEYNFIITAELVLDCPDDLTVASCQTQQDIDLQFQDWLDEFSFTGGQNAMSSNDNMGAPPACGGTTTVTWTVTSDCEPDVTCSATFTVTPDNEGPDLTGCDPSDLNDTHECDGPSGNEAAAEIWNLANIATLEGCVTDNCGDFDVTSDYDFANLVGACASTGTLLVNYTVTDNCNNSSVISATFTIEDNTEPDLTLCDPADLNATHECDGPAGNETAADAWDLANIAALEICASDLCGDITVSSDYDFENLSTICGNTGTILVTYTVTDECNNSSTISGTFTIEDTTDPDLSLCTQSDLDFITECSGAMGNEAAANLWNANNIATLEGCATDACGDFVVMSDYDFANYSDDCGLTGSITVTYTVTDDCNNTSTITGTFAIEDTTEPDLTGCDPADLNDTHECDGPAGNEAAAIAWDLANIAALEICATDACGTVTATSDYDFANLNNDCGNTGTILVTYTVTDECSNTSTITGTFTIEDLTAPDLTGCDPDDLDATHECTGPAGNETAADAWNLANIATLEGCAMDDCGDFTVTSDYDFANLVGACAATGTLTVTYTVTDDCSNTSTITGTFTIEDNTEPDLTLCDPADLNATHECDGPAGNETAADVWDLANIAALEICASDLCGDITVSSDYDFANLSVVCGNTGTILVTYTVTDECNNSSTISGTFTIEDTTDPDLSLCTQSDLDLITDCNGAMGNESAADMWNAANIAALEMCADDACGDFVVTSDYDFTNYSDECGLTGSITVTYTVTDDCNNTSTIEGTFAIIDTIPPSLIGCDPNELNDTHECTGSAGNEAAATAWDAANIATLESCAFEICGDITVSSDYDFNNLDIDCGITGELIVTYTVTDECNNTTTITGTFTIEDMTNPSWDQPMPSDMTVSCDLVPVFDASFTASDDCDVNVMVDTMETSTQDPDIQECGHYEYTLTRTWTATDDCDNSITHVQTITVEDNNPPVFNKPDDVTIYTSQGATCPTIADISLMINQNDPIAVGGASYPFTVHGIAFEAPTMYSDTCADVSALEIRVHNVQPDFDGMADNCYRYIRVVWRVYDPCGNYTARQQYFTIIDNSDPTFMVPADITVFTDEDCEYNIDSTLTGIPTMVEDNCTTDPLVYYNDSNPAPGSCEGEVTITRTWFVVDDCDNETSQMQVITVRDTISPTFTVPGDITIYKDEMCMHDADTLLTGYVMDEADNCTATLNATFTDDMQAGSCGGEMIITRTWRLEDDCNNVTTQNQVITVRDTLLPIFPKPADMTLSTEDGATCPTDFDLSIEVNQNVPIATGNTPFTFMVHGIEIDGPTVYSDNCSNGDSLRLFVWNIIEDNDPVADNCYRQIRILWRVYDACGNYQPRNQVFSIYDETAPTFMAPADITIFKDEDCEHDDSVAFTGDVTDEDDNCSLGLEATFTDQVVAGPCEGTLVITRTWTLEDDCNNAADPQIQIITVSDNTKPTFTVPADITILKDANCDHDADISITGDVDDEADNCTTMLDATFVDAVADGPCEGSLVITRTWTLIDNCGNDSIQTQIITVSDSIDPFFPKPADMTLSTLDGATCPAVTDISLVINQNDPVATANEPFTFTVHGIEIDGPVVYTDNCSSPENLGVYVWNINEDFDGMAGNCYRQIQVIFRVYDDCGNFQQRQQVFTINEETPPVAVCNDVTIYLDENGEVNLTPQEVGGASSDNCDPDPLLTISKDFFTCDDVGNNDITFTIEDFCMLSDQCVAKVQVRDTVPPNAQCKNVTVFLDINGLAFITVPDIDNGSTDACGIASLVLSRTDFFCSDLGDVAVTLTVTDVNNNVSTCIGIVEVRDDIAPVALCKPVSVNLDGQGLANVVPLDMDDGSSDNCGIVDYQLSKTQFDCTNLGSNLITFTVFDAAGNSSTCQANVQVSDVSSPNMACKNLTLYLNAQGSPITIQPANINNGTNDNCTITSLTISMSTFDCSTTGQNVVKLIAVDQSGNSGECSAIVTVRDTFPPVWTFVPDDVTVFCIESAADEEPEATDNCVDILISLVSDQQEIWPAGPPNSYLVRRIWRAEDASGNEIFHEQIVYVLPGGQLFVNCNPDIITEETNIPIQVDWPIPFVDDICAGKSDMYQIGGPLPNSYFNPGSETIITYEFIDAFGTRFQCAFWVIVPTDSSDYVVILNEQTCDRLQLEDCQIRDLPAPDNYSFEIVIPNQLPILHKVDNNTRLEMFADGTAHLTGSWVDLPGFCGWEFDIWFHRRRTYEGWLKAGGSVNSFFGADPTGWDFFEVDATRSNMVGTGCNVGTEYDLSISPNFAKFGLQLGVAANTKSVGYGGWVVLGLREPGNENLFAQGIFSFELDCQPTEVLKDAATFVSLDGFPYGVEWSTGNTSYELGDVAPGMYSITITQPGNIDSIAFFSLEYPTDCELYYDQQCRPGNYAPGKSLAKQSSTQQNFVAALAVDGNTDGDLANGSVSSTLAGFQNWLSVALDFPQPIERVRVWSRTDCCQDVLDPLWLFISELPIPELTDPDVLATLPDMNAYYHVGPIETYVDFEFEGQMGQYLKVQLDESGRLQLAEVQVLVCQEDALGLQVENFGNEDETEEASRSDFDLVPTVSTWPSPASNLMEVSIAQEMAQPLHISIVNMHGSEVFTTDLDADTFHRLTLDVGQWQPGLYFMTTTSPIGASSKPILIQR